MDRPSTNSLLVRLKAVADWLKHRKGRVAVHSLILIGFLIYCVFLAGPLFDRFNALEGESKLHHIVLPAESNNINYFVDGLVISANSVDPVGWAFIRGEGCEGSETYVVLKSNAHTYIFDTLRRQNLGLITNLWIDTGLNVEWSGFEAMIPLRRLAWGRYVLGFYIRKGDLEALQYTDQVVVKAANSARATPWTSKLQQVSLPEESQGMRFNIENVKEVDADGTQLVEIGGWAFLEGHNVGNRRVFLVLKSAAATYVVDTAAETRRDVTNYFETLNLDLDGSGFVARIPKEWVGAGGYVIGIYIQQGDIEALHYTWASL